MKSSWVGITCLPCAAWATRSPSMPRSCDNCSNDSLVNVCIQQGWLGLQCTNWLWTDGFLTCEEAMLNICSFLTCWVLSRMLIPTYAGKRQRAWDNLLLALRKWLQPCWLLSRMLIATYASRR